MNIRMVGESNLFNSSAKSNQPNRTFNPVNCKIAGQEKGVKDENKDSASISPLGKTVALIERLIKERQEVKDARNELIKVTFAAHKDLDSIQEQLDAYDEQLQAIDEQLLDAKKSKIELEKQESEDKKIEKKEAKKEKLEAESKSKTKTQEEAMNDTFSNIVNAATTIDQIKISQAVRRRADNKVNILRTESKLDTGMIFKSNAEEIDELQNLSENMSGRIKQQISSATKSINKASLTDEDDNTNKLKHNNDKQNKQKSINILV